MTANALRTKQSVATMDDVRHEQPNTVHLNTVLALGTISAGGIIPSFGASSAVEVFPNILPAPTTASTYELPSSFERTAAGPDGQLNPVAAESTSEAVFEVRRRTGLTWEELGELFNVSRRSVHHWANGKPVSAGHERMLREILDAVRHLDRGNQESTRAALLAIDPHSGISKFDLLRDGRIGEAVSRIDRVQQPHRRWIPLSRTAQEARRTPAPTSLLGAIQDRPRFPAKARMAPAVRASRTSRTSKPTE